MKSRKNALLILILAAQFVTLGAASAQYIDQDEPKHGGVTNWNTNSEYSFELVAKKRAVTLYIEDHDGPVLTAGAKGTLVVSRNGSTKTANLAPAGANRLVARGLLVAPTDHVIATVTLANGSIMLGRFTLR